MPPFRNFFWGWLAILLLLASGYWMLFTTFGGFVGAGLYIHLMQMIGWLMIALFVWLFHGPWLTFKRAVDAEDWPSAGATLNRIRQIIAVNLPLGLLVVVIGGGGRYWGQLSVGQLLPPQAGIYTSARHFIRGNTGIKHSLVAHALRLEPDEVGTGVGRRG